MKWTTTDREILRLAQPCIVSNVTVPLLGLVDLSIVGHLESAAYIAAISVGTMIFNVMYWLMGFLRMGTSGMTSQAYGLKDYAGLRRLLRRVLLMSLTIGVVFLLFQESLLQLAFWIICPSETIRPFVTCYFNILVWGAPAMLGIYGLTGWSIGMQNTRIPMYVAIFQNVINIVTSLFFVMIFHWDIAGVAAGTLVAQWVGFLFALCLVVDKWHGIPRPQNLSTHQVHWKLTKGEVDIFIRTICLVVVNLAFTAFGARQGDLLLAVNTLLMTFFSLFSYIMDGFAFAGEALAGKAYGAADSQTLHFVARHLFRWGWALAMMFTLVYVCCADGLLAIITNDLVVIAAAHDYLFWAWLIPVAGMSAFVYDGIFIGMMNTRGMLTASLLAACLFFLVYAMLEVLIGNHALWAAYLFFLTTRGMVQYAIWKRKIIEKV